MMNLEQLFCEYAKSFTGENQSIQDAGSILSGFASMYHKTGNEIFKLAVENYTDTKIKTISMESFALSNAVRFLYEETKEERYLDAMKQMMTLFLSSKRNEDGVPVREDDSLYPAEELYAIYPFYAWYDTNFNKKENYLVLMKELKYITCRLLDASTTPLVEREYLMMMLAQTVDGLSEEIYEHYTMVKSWLKKAVHSTLGADGIEPAMMSYILFKGSQTKSLLAEKYVPVGERLFADAIEALSNQSLDRMKASKASALMMAYALR